MKRSGTWKKATAVTTALLIAATVWQTGTAAPEIEAASKISEINKQLEAIKKQTKDAAATQKSAEKESKDVLALKNQAASSVNEILKQLDEVGQQMNGVQKQIDQTEDDLMQAGQQLEEAEDRVEKRDKMLQSRLRLMYQNGVVSYLDVLMSATSFTDFVDRFDALQAIVNQDKDVLEQHKKDKALIAQKKVEIENKLSDVKEMYTKLDDYQTVLAEKEKTKEKLIAEYNQKMEELEDISEEQEQLMVDLAKKQADLERKKREEQKKQTVFYTGGKLAVPLKDSYRISSGFGYRIHPIYHTKKLHAGIDMAAPEGTSIYAAEGGVVITAGWTSGYGNTVILDHGNGLWTLYGHIRNGGIKVKVGDSVKRGEKIAEVGSTGNSTGNHLHFEVRVNGTPKDPTSYLK
ncbi:murein DD-endopeptidase MepM/ murein hydrolase activator NlpD [Paenibacillus cellulosilyticus]|uniref:Murein DD-endopeptidase MepM/ murein hydrolase activator NlpD n=1 Tax=Paenibacillus cellulosilyticus TaxID=375489 RepID=A0A2V2Z0J9_9BACL|nr:M23 family metallopeptidase [Paenibacillus cellulosilyticus]PWW08302.1 murein DD-endopeptidase MepM/ murein hydrolase activator NlpD [Paenibacillus cellulosilyticus]QKS47902.1 peptidoglycan DD-metalloendopeptidase family protein [Paenibacillus cellulosilyticus]